jgi:hypothetical protein
MDKLYIDANFKETQLQPGWFPARRSSLGRCYDGQDRRHRLDRSPASGSVFSLLPPENATGNFTKVVQRVPVRIDVPRPRAEERAAARRPECRRRRRQPHAPSGSAVSRQVELSGRNMGSNGHGNRN